MSASQRIVIIERLLETYSEVCSQDEMGEGVTTHADDRVLTMSKLWKSGSYQQLESILKTMRDERSSQYWHVAERYIRSESKRELVRFRKSAKGPKPLLPKPHMALEAGAALISGEGWVRVRVWDPRVRLEKVRRGLEWIDGEFQRRYEKAKRAGDPRFARWQPQLPRELLERAA